MPVIDRSAISDCHYINTRNDGKKQIIVRFVSPQTVKTVYKHKKNLKITQDPMYKGVFITDDVTPLRLRLKRVVSKIPGVETAYFRDGNIHCKYKNTNYVFSSPEDIFDKLKVDVTDDMLKELGLENFKQEDEENDLYTNADLNVNLSVTDSVILSDENHSSCNETVLKYYVYCYTWLPQ